MEATETREDIKHLHKINESRIIIEDLFRLSSDLKNGDYFDVVNWHEGKITYHMDLLNKYYKTLTNE